MTLPSRPMHIPAGLPIDEGTRPEILDVGGANVSNVNARRVRRGVLGKRLGYAPQTKARLDATTRSAGARLFCQRDVVGVIDGAYLDVYSDGAAVNATRGRVPDCSVTMRPSATYSGELSGAALLDLAVCGNFAAYAYEVAENDPISAQTELLLYVEDVTTGAAIRAPELIFTTAVSGLGFPTPVCCLGSYGTYLLAVFFDSEVGTLKAYYLNTASASTLTTGWVAVSALGLTAATPGVFALSLQSLPDRVAIAFVNSSAGASQVSVATINISGTIQAVSLNSGGLTPQKVAIEGSATDTLWITWNQGTAVKVCGLSATSLSTVLASTATMLTLNSASQVPSIGIVSSATAGHGRVIATDGSIDRLQMRGFKTTAGATAADGSQVTVPNALLGSRPFRVGSRYFALFAPAPGNSTNAQRTAVLCDFTDDNTWLRPVANLAPSLAVLPGLLACHVESLGSSRYLTGLSVVTNGAGNITNAVTFDFADRNRWRTVSHNNETMLSGGLLASFGGSRAAELGFVVRPTKPSMSAAGGGSLTGNYRYVVVFEQVDANGNWAVSSISDPALIPSLTSAVVTVTVRPCSITARQVRSKGADVRISIYRTTGSGSPPYYFVGSLMNDTSAVSISLADDTDDATLTTQRELYSPTLPGSGSAQDRRAPPHCQDLESYNGMLVVASGSTLWWSGQTVDGEQTWFNPAFTVPVEGDGDITAIRAMDGTLYVFKRRGLWAVAGEAPSDNGAQGGLGTPRRIAADVGCIDPSSCVVTSAGLFFQSARGIELLQRNGSVMWVGENMRQTLASYPVVSSAVLDDVEGLAIFSLAASESGGAVSGSGVDLVYDLTINGWISKDDKTGSSAHEASQDGAMLTVSGKRRYGWLGTDGTVHYRKLSTDSDAYLDGSSFVVGQYELPPWKTGLQQQQRVYEMELLFERESAAGLEIDIAHDFGAYSETKTWTETDIAAQRQVSFRPKPQTTAVQLRVKETAPAVNGTGQGLTFIGISADIAPKQGTTRGTTRLNPDLRR